MECPRCDGPLGRYALGDREAVRCESCGYVGVPVEHRGERRRAESWEEVVSRYADAAAAGSVTVETVDGEPAIEVALESDPDSGDSDPKPTVVRVDRPDPRLASAFEAAEGSEEEFVCDICGSAFGSQAGLYGHLAVHSGDGNDSS